MRLRHSLAIVICICCSSLIILCINWILYETSFNTDDSRYIVDNIILRHGLYRYSNQTNDAEGTAEELVSVTATGALYNVLCDEECIEFRQYQLKWPADRPRGVIYYLTQSQRLQTGQLQTSLTALDKHFNAKYGYPIVIFHEKDLSSESLQSKIRSFVSTRVFFQPITFDIPDFINQSRVKFNIPCISHISYRHMCRFHAKGVYEQPILRGVEYVWRMDDDSLLLAKLPYDIFRLMRDRGIVYGYKLIYWDSVVCVEGLWPAVKEYAKNRSISSSSLFAQWPVARMFYNNFEISALSFWISPEYRQFIDYIDRLGGVYYARWGDAPIKSLALAMFVPPRAWHRFMDVAYQHGHFVNNSFVGPAGRGTKK